MKNTTNKSYFYCLENAFSARVGRGRVKEGRGKGRRGEEGREKVLPTPPPPPPSPPAPLPPPVPPTTRGLSRSVGKHPLVKPFFPILWFSNLISTRPGQCRRDDTVEGASPPSSGGDRERGGEGGRGELKDRRWDLLRRRRRLWVHFARD